MPPEEQLVGDESALTISQLHRRVKTKIALEFRGLVWVEGEVKNVRDNRGHRYLTLVEPGSADVGDVTLDAVCWAKQWRGVSLQLRQAGVDLVNGVIVRLRGQVTFSKFGKVQLEIVQVDTDALLGRRASDRRRLYEALRVEGLLEANRRLPIPLVPLRVGLVASEGSEGHNDFLGQLVRSGFAYEIHLRHSPVQGPAAPASLARAISELSRLDLDVIAVVRGGGGELDAFDREPVARAIATSRLPVWTGIGHTGDRAISDDVAQQSFITPTECGQALVVAVDDYCRRISALIDQIATRSVRCLDQEAARATNAGRHVSRAASSCVQGAEIRLHRQAERARRSVDRDVALAAAALTGNSKDLMRAAQLAPLDASDDLASVAGRILTAARLRLDLHQRAVLLQRTEVRVFDPIATLRRGWSLTRTRGGRLVRFAADVSPGDDLVTVLPDGSVSSTVTVIALGDKEPA